MIVTVLDDERSPMDRADGEIHKDERCRAILAREARRYDPADYKQFPFDQVSDEVPACQFPECFQGMADAGAIRAAGHTWMRPGEMAALLGLGS